MFSAHSDKVLVVLTEDACSGTLAVGLITAIRSAQPTTRKENALDLFRHKCALSAFAMFSVI